MRVLGLLISTLVLLGLSGPAVASAAAPPVTQALPSGISVTPALEQLQLSEGQNEAQFDVQLTNNTKYAVQVKVNFADFKALNESGGIAFLGENATALQKTHGLAKWVQLTTQQVGLEPNKSTTLKVRFTNLKSLSPGGHYGAVTYQVLKAGPNGPGNKVMVNQVLTTLVFLVTAGGGTQHLDMLKPTVHGVQFRIPSHLDLFFKNTGNTQTAPRGSVTIDGGNAKDPVATAVLNSEGALVLPGSTRLLPTDLKVFGRPWWPHQYHVRVQYRPDNATKFTGYTASFLYINPWAVILTPILAVGGGYGLVWLRRHPAVKAGGIVVKKHVRAGAHKTRKVIHRKQG